MSKCYSDKCVVAMYNKDIIILNHLQRILKAYDQNSYCLDFYEVPENQN